MIRKELDQAIPPAYTQFLGQHLITHLRGGVLNSNALPEHLTKAGGRKLTK